MDKQKSIDFEGQPIYVGLDVHLNSWSVTIATDYIIGRTFSINNTSTVLKSTNEGDAYGTMLLRYLQTHYPGGDYYTAYEAGFCGFSVHYELTKLGLSNIVVNPANNRTGHEKYIWYNPPGQRMMYFTQNLNLENAMYYIPGVIYVATKNFLHIFAFKGKKPVNKLYKAPFFNVTGASVCLGSANLDYPESPDYKDLLLYWEKKFWMTEFSHLGGHSNPTKSNLFAATKKWKDSFDYDELLPHDQLLKDLLK